MRLKPLCKDPSFDDYRVGAHQASEAATGVSVVVVFRCNPTISQDASNRRFHSRAGEVEIQALTSSRSHRYRAGIYADSGLWQIGVAPSRSPRYRVSCGFCIQGSVRRTKRCRNCSHSRHPVTRPIFVRALDRTSRKRNVEKPLVGVFGRELFVSYP